MDWFIKYLEDAEEELGGAKEYAKSSACHRKSGKHMEADHFAEMSRQEIAHADELAKMAEKHYHAAGEEEKKSLLPLWNWVSADLARKKKHIHEMLQ